MKVKKKLLNIFNRSKKMKKMQQRESLKKHAESLYKNVVLMHDRVGWNRDPFLDAMVCEFYRLFHALQVIARTDFEGCVNDLEYLHAMIRDYLHIKEAFVAIQDRRFNRPNGIDVI